MLFHVGLLLRSLRKSGVKNYTCNLTVGPQQLPDYELQQLRKECPFIKINQYYTSEHGFNPPYLGGVQRWYNVPDADVYALIDVDGIVCGDLSTVIDRCCNEKKIMGVRNIGSPFRFHPTASLEEWKHLEKVFGIKFNYVLHNGVNISQFDTKHFWIPDLYFNYGFILVPKELKDALSQQIPIVVGKLEKIGKNFWNGEVALCIILQMLRLPAAEIEQKYNYPDRIEFFSRIPCNDIRFLHMVRKTIKSKEDFERIKKNPTTSVERFIQLQIHNLYNKAILLQ